MSVLPALLSKHKTLNALQKATAALNWDRQVVMPPGGAAARTAHVGELTRLAHELATSDEYRRLLEEAAAEVEPESEAAATLRVLRRESDLMERTPRALVVEKAAVSSEAYEVWKAAREAADFAPMEPYLARLFDIAGRTAEALGYREHLYDPLLDLFEEGATTADAQRMFDTIQPPITEMVRRIQEAPPVDDSFLQGPWDDETLRSAMLGIMKGIGFDFESGRLDVAPNAFCSNFSVGDVRMTTRPASHLKGIVFSSLHEMGHALYEQNSPLEWDRQPLCGGISLGIHESQSRLWENIVGRSAAFWKWALPFLQAAFPGRLDVDSERFAAAVNKVEPGPVRIGADELTYNLHIQVRFELECEVLTGQVAVRDLPDAWNGKYQRYLGVIPANDGVGVLQDVHWSRGSMGYFPTYAMGNLIGGQVWAALSQDLPDVQEQMARGEFRGLLGWLVERIYRNGKRYTPKELLGRVVGREMRADEWLAYAKAKFGEPAAL